MGVRSWLRRRIIKLASGGQEVVLDFLLTSFCRNIVYASHETDKADRAGLNTSLGLYEEGEQPRSALVSRGFDSPQPSAGSNDKSNCRIEVQDWEGLTTFDRCCLLMLFKLLMLMLADPEVQPRRPRWQKAT